MKVRQWINGIVLLLLMAVAVVGLLRTRDPGQAPEDDEAGRPAASKKLLARSAPRAQRSLVDLRPLLTARRMAALASTQDEQALAHEAEKIGDHEVDLAFFDALRTSEENPPKLTPEAQQLADRKNKAAQAVKDDQEAIALLTRKLAAAPEAQKDNLQDQIDVAKAQMDLDQDELDDAAEDLAQAGGDPESKIKRLKEQHESSEHNETPVGSAANPREADYQTHTLLTVFRAWQALREKQAKLEEARQEATTKQQRLSQRHEKLTAKVEQEKENRQAAKQQATGFAKGADKAASREESKAAARTALDSLKQYTRDQKNLADLGRRVQDEQELTDIYGKWIGVVENRERAALHNIIGILLWILVVLLVVYLANRATDRLFTGVAAENKRIDTLRAVVKFAAQAVGAIVILFLIVGLPSQTTTILGLAGAGLTVAMKDFIVAFFGWFVLMGRNGIRVGDWVEINGVGGEVVEIGLLKTVLLETGSWSDSGHPTGRRVSFVNSFAIEGHFFNFSTSGQWMWDELQILIPPGQDPYPVIDGIQKLVEKETEANAKTAEVEWQHVTTRYKVQAFSAVPGINVLPTAAGIEVRVRYITRAYERHEARRRLYEAVVGLMHGKREAVKA
ncbi:MAG: mechanosensitive ion channel [Acidobacteriia bacterium]|nr:mechanosensitive ion channel [Terriglobia bacterium]